MANLPDGYPDQWETDALLKDGATVRVRPIRPDDAARMERFHNRQSQESIYFRYFRFRPKLTDQELERFTVVDYVERMAFVALIGDEMVAVSRYEGEGTTDHSAEVAFFVDDQHHGRGLATLMLEYLAQRARAQGIHTFTATVLPENFRMLGVFKNAGFDVSSRFEDGAIAVTLGIGDPQAAQDAIDSREQQSRSRAVERFFEPESVAVVGAGRRPGSVGHELLRSLVDGSFAGEIIAVNPNAKRRILSTRTVASLSELDDPVDLAIVALPAESVFGAVAECIEAGVKAVIVVSAGFTDEVEEGRQRLAALVRLVRDGGVRLLGPLSYGVVNTDPEIALQAHFLPVDVPVGDIGLLSQSGPLGAAILSQLAGLGLGVSTFMSAGLRADVSVYDVLQYWIADDRTNTVALYLENFGNPRNFLRVARRISEVKPVVAVTPADPDLAAVARAGGVVLVDHVSDLVDQVRLMSSQPVPAGNSVVVVSNAASVAKLARSACEKAGLTIVAPSETAVEGVLADGAGSILIDNADTLTFTLSTDSDTFERAVVAAALSEAVDSVLLALVPTPALPAHALAEIVRDVDRAVDKPVVAVNLIGEDAQVHRPPTFAYPEQAADALGRMASYSLWRRARHRDTPVNDVDCGPLVDAVAAALGDRHEVELESYDDEAVAVIEALQLPVPPSHLVTTESEASHAADELGYPVALKASWRTDRRAGEAGGTVLDIRHRQHLKRAFKRMGGSSERPIIIQRMHGTGAHVRFTMQQTPQSGSHLFLGIGGLGRSDYPPMMRVVIPAEPSDFASLATDATLRVLAGGHDPKPLIDLVEKLSVAASCCRDLAEIDLNPVLLSDVGAVAVDASVTLRRWPENPLASVRTA
ncbi:MAG: GNAT family N-acetyltransferase [Acidimicrobiales bacterium]|nr:GNAT family N-acetyltransferase [Acidimicrobiales bacterium]